jgi:hypothetical protein
MGGAFGLGLQHPLQCTPVYYSLVSCKVSHFIGGDKYGFNGGSFMLWIVFQTIQYVQMTQF